MLTFPGVFGEVAVIAKAEALHCAALRRQRVEVSILSGAPIFSTAYPKLYLARFSFGQTLLTQRVELVDIWDEAIGLSQPDIVRWKLNFGSVCFGRRQSP